MKIMNKRIFTLLLALVMISGYLPNVGILNLHSHETQAAVQTVQGWYHSTGTYAGQWCSLGSGTHSATCSYGGTFASQNYTGEILPTYPSVVSFNYTGGVQPFTAPVTGTYVLEAAGAGGGGADPGSAPRGGFISGYANLVAGQVIYIAVGEKGKYNGGTAGSVTSWNGGGSGDAYGGSGGGATHIATTNRGILVNYNSYREEVLLVAGGSGGAADTTFAREGTTGTITGTGGVGGGLTGGSGLTNGTAATGGTQTQGGSGGGASSVSSAKWGTKGSFGKGGNYGTEPNSGGGGGAGWFGGGGGTADGSAGGGGSSYIKSTLTLISNVQGGGSLGGANTIGDRHGDNGYARITQPALPANTTARTFKLRLKDSFTGNYITGVQTFDLKYSNGATISTISLTDGMTVIAPYQQYYNFVHKSGTSAYIGSSQALSIPNVSSGIPELVLTLTGKSTGSFSLKSVYDGSNAITGGTITATILTEAGGATGVGATFSTASSTFSFGTALTFGNYNLRLTGIPTTSPFYHYNNVNIPFTWNINGSYIINLQPKADIFVSIIDTVTGAPIPSTSATVVGKVAGTQKITNSLTTNWNQVNIGNMDFVGSSEFSITSIDTAKYPVVGSSSTVAINQKNVYVTLYVTSKKQQTLLLKDGLTNTPMNAGESFELFRDGVSLGIFSTNSSGILDFGQQLPTGAYTIVYKDSNPRWEDWNRWVEPFEVTGSQQTFSIYPVVFKTLNFVDSYYGGLSDIQGAAKVSGVNYAIAGGQIVAKLVKDSTYTLQLPVEETRYEGRHSGQTWNIPYTEDVMTVNLNPSRRMTLILVDERDVVYESSEIIIDGGGASKTLKKSNGWTSSEYIDYGDILLTFPSAEEHLTASSLNYAVNDTFPATNETYCINRKTYIQVNQKDAVTGAHISTGASYNINGENTNIPYSTYKHTGVPAYLSEVVTDELSPPVNYVSNEMASTGLRASRLFETETTFTPEVLFNYTTTHPVSLKAVDADTGVVIEGLEFEYFLNGTLQPTKFTTGSNGLVDISDIPSGTNFVAEFKHSNKYDLYQQADTVTVPNNLSGSVTLTVNVTRKRGSITVQASNGTTEETLPSFNVEIIDINGAVSEHVIPEGGLLTLPNLPYGTYTVREKSAPGHTWKQTWSEILKIEDANINAVVVVNPYEATAQVKVKVINTITSVPIVGAVVKDNRGNVYITDSSGVAFISQVDLGDNFLTIESVPAPYQLQATITLPYRIEFESSSIGELVEIFVNASKKIDANITVRDRLTNAVIQNIGLQIKSVAPTPQDFAKTSNSSGLVQVNNIVAGLLEVTAVSQPSDTYKLNMMEVFDVLDDTLNVTYFLDRNLGDVQIIAEDSVSGSKLQGAVFSHKVTWESSGTNVTTNTVGIAQMNNLPYGTHTLMSVTPPSGYDAQGWSQSFTLNSSTTGTIITIKFDKLTAQTLVAIDELTGGELEGVKFQIKETDTTYVSSISGANGEAEAEGVLPGVYGVHLVSITNPRFINDTAYLLKTIEIGNTNERWEVIIPRKKGVLTLHAHWDTGLNVVGAVYEHYMNGVLQGEVTTDSQGKITLNNVIMCDHRFVEKSVPVFTKPMKYDVSIDFNSTPKTVELLYEEVKGMRLTVIDDLTGDFVRNIKVGFFQGMQMDDITKPLIKETTMTDSMGVAQSVTLYEGEWQALVMEDESNMYSMTYYPKIRVGVEDPNVEVRLVRNTGYLVYKLLNQLQQPISGVTYSLTPLEWGSDVDTVYATSDAEGLLVFTDVVYGKYSIKEVGLPDTYSPLNLEEIIDFDLRSDLTPKLPLLTEEEKLAGVTQEPPELVFNRTLVYDVFGSVSVSFMDNLDGGIIPNVGFKLVYPDGVSVAHNTGAGGVKLIEALPSGTYKIELSSVPSGYLNEEKITNVEITSTETSVKPLLTRTTVNMNLKVQDEKTGAPIVGATFRATNKNNGYTKVFTSDILGVVQMTDLPQGEYQVEEITVPNPYSGYKYVLTIVLDSKTNPSAIGSTTIVKYTSTAGLVLTVRDIVSGQLVDNVEYKIFQGALQISYDSVIQAIQFVKSGLKPGDYKVSINRLNSMYNLLEEEKTVTLSGVDVPLEFKAERKKGSITYQLVDSYRGLPVEGVVWEIHSTNPSIDATMSQHIFTSNSDGQIQLEDIYYGEYSIVLVSLPSSVDSSVINRTLVLSSGNSGTKVVVELEKTMPLTIVCRSSIDVTLPIAGAKYDLYDASMNLVQAGLISNSIGEIRVQDLRQRDYILRPDMSSALPAGYTMDPSDLVVSITNEPKKVLVYFSIATGAISISVSNELGSPIYPSTFEIINADSGLLMTVLVTSTNGQVRSGALIAGDYIVRETSAPDGYIPNRGDVHVKVEGSEVHVPHHNNISYGRLVIQFKDTNYTNDTNSSIGFKLTDKGGSSSTHTTNSSGYIDISGLVPGTATIEVIGNVLYKDKVFTVNVVEDRFGTASTPNKLILSPK